MIRVQYRFLAAPQGHNSMTEECRGVASTRRCSTPHQGEVCRWSSCTWGGFLSSSVPPPGSVLSVSSCIYRPTGSPLRMHLQNDELSTHTLAPSCKIHQFHQQTIFQRLVTALPGLNFILRSSWGENTKKGRFI